MTCTAWFVNWISILMFPIELRFREITIFCFHVNDEDVLE